MVHFAFLFSFLFIAMPLMAADETDAASAPDTSQLKMKALEDAKKEIAPILTSAPAPTTLKILTEAIDSCTDGIERGRHACLESLSPNIKEASTVIGTLMPVLQALTGAKDQCSQVGDLMKNLSGLLGAYNGACGGMKAMCSSSCSNGMAKAKAASSKSCKADSTKEKDPIKSAAILKTCVAAAESAKVALTEGKSACTGFEKNLASGLASLSGVMQTAKTADACKKDVTAEESCQKDPSSKACDDSKGVVNCNRKENEALPKCICEKNPRAAGCPDSQNNSSATTPNISKGSDGTGGTEKSTSGLSGGADAQNDGSSNRKSSDSGGGGPLAAGGGGGSGGSLGGRAGAADGKGGTASKPLNTNILGGEYGGGGGSGGSGSHGSGYGDTPYGKYGGYLPKDRLKGDAVNSPDQVTGSSGLTNWEKVKIRYKESRTTLRP